MKKYLIILLTALFCSFSLGGECKLFGWLNIVQKADVKFVEKLKDLIARNKDIETSPRYSNLQGGDVKKAWAHQDTRISFCEAGAVQNNNIGTQAADSFVDTLTHTKVANAIDVPYDKIGRGLGQVSKHIDDAKCKKMLEGWRGNLDNNIDDINPFHAKGYNSAHALRDCDDVFALDLPGQERLADNLSLQGDWGNTYQLNATAQRIRRKGNDADPVSEIECDRVGGPNSDVKGADYKAKSGFYNVKLSAETLYKHFNPTQNKNGMSNVISGFKAARAKGEKYFIETNDIVDIEHASVKHFKEKLQKALSDPEPAPSFNFTAEEFAEIFVTTNIQ